MGAMRVVNLVSVAVLLISGCVSMNPQYHVRLGYEPGEDHCEFIIEHSKTKAEAYSLAENWIAKQYTSANTVVQQRDRGSGVIVIRAMIPFSVGNLNYSQSYVYYTMEIRVKNNKSKISFDLGGITTYGSITENPKYAPPQYQMGEILSGFEDIKCELSDIWNRQRGDDDF